MRARSSWLVLALVLSACGDSPAEPTPEPTPATLQLVASSDVAGCWSDGYLIGILHLAEDGYGRTWQRDVGGVERPLSGAEHSGLFLRWNADRVFGTFWRGEFTSPIGMVSAFQECRGPAALIDATS